MQDTVGKMHKHLDVAHGILDGGSPSESHHYGAIVPPHQATGVKLGLPEQLMLGQAIHMECIGQSQSCFGSLHAFG